MKFLVVGCGSIGQRHVANILSLGAGEVSVCDTNPEALSHIQKSHKVTGYSSLERALEGRPDAVLVCTPTSLHIPVARTAVKAGAHLFIEKPLSSSLEGVSDLLKEAREAKRIILVGCNMRFHPGVRHLKESLERGFVRQPQLLRAHFSHYLPNWRPAQDYRLSYSAKLRQGGGVVMEGVHEIDYLRWLSGEVERIVAHGGHFSDLEIDSEDTALILMYFKNGSFGEIHLDYLRPLKSRGCEIVASNGVLRWISEGKTPESIRVEYYDPARSSWRELYSCPAYDANLMYLEELKHFLDCLAQKSISLLNGEEARRILELALAAQNQMASGSNRRLEELLSEKGSAGSERSLDNSRALLERARRVIPSCSQTFSKAPEQFVQGVSPIFLQRGIGSHVWDVDGNEYIDYPMALGPIILGHNDPTVSEAVIRQMKDGTIFSLPHPLEVELAELLAQVIPSAEMVRFGKNGSDATAGAVRVARAYTGREVIACCGYHGWQDWYVGTTTRNKGVPKATQALTIPFEYNSMESLERIFTEHPGRVAAVIMEPVGVVEPRDNFLARILELVHREGALLIFDEVVTGFRLHLGGAQAHFGVTPDLSCFGKGMANGYPISAVVGRRDIMELFDEVFFSFTFGGETVALAAALATITEVQGRGVISHLWRQGRKLKEGYNLLAREFGLDRFTECIGLPPRTVIQFRDREGRESLVYKSLFQQECIRRGVLFTGNQNICYSHSDADVEYTLQVYQAAFEILAEAIRAGDASKRLVGEPVRPVFRRA